VFVVVFSSEGELAILQTTMNATRAYSVRLFSHGSTLREKKDAALV
jgi:hypothetical protein